MSKDNTQDREGKIIQIDEEQIKDHLGEIASVVLLSLAMTRTIITVYQRIEDTLPLPLSLSPGGEGWGEGVEKKGDHTISTWAPFSYDKFCNSITKYSYRCDPQESFPVKVTSPIPSYLSLPSLS